MNYVGDAKFIWGGGRRRGHFTSYVTLFFCATGFAREEHRSGSFRSFSVSEGVVDGNETQCMLFSEVSSY